MGAVWDEKDYDGLFRDGWELGLDHTLSDLFNPTFHQYIQFEAIISWEMNTDFTFKLHLNLNAFFLLFSIYKGTCKWDQRWKTLKNITQLWTDINIITTAVVI